MKAIHILPLFILMACNHNGNSMHYDYQDRHTNPLGAPTNPTQEFTDYAAEYNSKITPMYSGNEKRTTNYINYRLNQWGLYNKNIGGDIARTDIAAAANWLISGDYTADEITNHFLRKDTLMQMAMWVIDNRIYSCFGGTMGDIAQCFVKWRQTNEKYFDDIAAEIRRNTTNLNFADATFAATNGAQIKFTLDTNGYINGATITQDGTDTKYTTWMAHAGTDNENVFIDKMEYKSAGAELGLSYSDFGTYSITRTKFNKEAEKEQEQTIIAPTPMAGGYASQQVATDKIASDLAFTGRAIGNAQNADARINLDGAATLHFDAKTGISDLFASFENWYDISVNSDGDISFENYTNKNKEVMLSGDETAQGAQMNIGYYAENPERNIPTEATGTVHFAEDGPNGVELNMAFGAH